MLKEDNFNRFKAIAGVTFVIVLLLTFINILSLENEHINIYDIKNKYPLKISENIVQNFYPKTISSCGSTGISSSKILDVVPKYNSNKLSSIVGSNTPYKSPTVTLNSTRKSI